MPITESLRAFAQRAKAGLQNVGTNVRSSLRNLRIGGKVKTYKDVELKSKMGGYKPKGPIAKAGLRPPVEGAEKTTAKKEEVIEPSPKSKQRVLFKSRKKEKSAETKEREDKEDKEKTSKQEWVELLVGAAASGTSMFWTLYMVFGSAFNEFIIAPLVGQLPHLVFIPYLIVGTVFFLIGLMYMSRGLKIGALATLATIIGIAVIIPYSPNFIAWAISGGQFEQTFGKFSPKCIRENIFNPEGLMQCWAPAEEESPDYQTGSKTYELLRVRLGDRVPGYQKYTYEIPAAYAHPETELTPEEIEKYSYELPFYIENVNEEGEDPLEGVYIDSVVFYKYRKKSDDEPINKFVSNNFADCCNLDDPDSPAEPCCICSSEEDYRCDIEPGSDNGAQAYTPRFMVPCDYEDYDDYRMQTEINITYDYSVRQSRSFIVAESAAAEQLIYERPDLKDDLLIPAPTDGPIDVLIDFENNPYRMEKRPDDRLRMKIWIKNEKVRGMYKHKDYMLRVEPLSDSKTWPDWLDVAPVTWDDCFRDGNYINIFLDGTDFHADSSGFIYDESLKYECLLKVLTPPEEDSYQKAVFAVNFEYTYRKYNSFASDRYLIDVDTHHHNCPTEESIYESTET